ncbi:MAG: hypothetical protein ACOVT5_03960 [Armatimonadaceae bacterium]
MSQQTYPVVCACGKVHQCPAGYAGSRFRCHCGQAVEVPSLSQLKAARGETVLSPELEISTLLSVNGLPLEPDCALCGCRTQDSLMVQVICESPNQQESFSPDISLISLFLSPITGIVVLPGADQSSGGGETVQVQLPIRMCQSCASDVESWDEIREAMRRTPVYRRLLRKYPESRLSTVKRL